MTHARFWENDGKGNVGTDRTDETDGKNLNSWRQGRVLRLGEPKAAVVHPVSDWE